MFMGRRGGPKVVFISLLSIFSGSLRSPLLYKHITCIHTFKFNVQYGTVILSLYFPYPNQENNPTSHPFIFFSSRITWFYTIYAKIFLGEDPQTPLPRHIYKIKTTISSVCLCREGPAIVQLNTPLLKINLYVDDCLKPYFCRREWATTTLRLKTFLPFSLLLFFFFFFLLVKIFGKLDPPPPDENSWIRAWLRLRPILEKKIDIGHNHAVYILHDC